MSFFQSLSEKVKDLASESVKCRFKIIQRRPYAFCLLIGDTK